MTSSEKLKELEELDISKLTVKDISNIKNNPLRTILLDMLKESGSGRTGGGRLTTGPIKHSSHQQEQVVPEPEPTE